MSHGSDAVGHSGDLPPCLLPGFDNIHQQHWAMEMTQWSISQRLGDQFVSLVKKTPPSAIGSLLSFTTAKQRLDKLAKTEEARWAVRGRDEIEEGGKLPVADN
jgi:hypothetical protein